MSEELERIIKSWKELDMKELMKFVSESEPDITELLKKYPEADVPEVDEFFLDGSDTPSVSVNKISPIEPFRAVSLRN